MSAIKVIYILALGHSGSTLLDLLLGANEECFSLGEITKFQDYCEKKLRPCTCDFIKGKYRPLSARDPKPAEYELCEFYRQIIGQIGHVPVLGTENYSIRRRLALKAFLPLEHLAASAIVQGGTSEDRVLFTTIFEAVKKIKPRLQYLVDSSKSLSRFFVLANQPEIDVHCLFLTREVNGFIHSYLKTPSPRGGFYYYLFVWLRRTILQARLLSKTGRTILWVRYEDLAKNSETELGRIGEFFGFTLAGDVRERVRDQVYHIIGGNRMSTGTRSFSGVRYADNWRNDLPGYQQWLGGLMQRLVYCYLRKVLTP